MSALGKAVGPIRTADLLGTHPKVEIVELHYAVLRTDGETQGRIEISKEVVENYAEAMIEGQQFPPLRACFDGTNYWLTDGFHRMAAAQMVGRSTLEVECFQGELQDARWDSYRANAAHGVRRTAEDTKLIVARTLKHEKALALSNYEIARHIGVSESTIRRFRSPSTQDNVDERVAVRNGHEYKICIGNIGKAKRRALRDSAEARATMERRLATDLLAMDGRASPNARRILTIFKNWTQRASDPTEVLRALEGVLDSLAGRHSQSAGALRK